MQAGQVSVWVTIAVAVLGITGVIAGQLVNAWREDRRWHRELRREDLRWERQSQKDHAERQHDARMNWREQRLEAYASWFAAATNWDYEWMRAMVYTDDGAKLNQTTQNELMHSLANLRAATSRVELLGSPSVVQQVKSIMRFMDRQWTVAQSPNRMNESSAENLQDIVDAELRWVLDDFRYDLGVADKIDGTELTRRLAIREHYPVTHAGNMPTSTTQQGH